VRRTDATPCCEFDPDNAAPDSPQPVSWSTDTDPYWSNLKATDPAAFQNNIRRLFFGDQQTLDEPAKSQEPTVFRQEAGRLVGKAGYASRLFDFCLLAIGQRLQDAGFSGRRWARLAHARGSGKTQPTNPALIWGGGFE
jgi:hypothetical protein